MLIPATYLYRYLENGLNNLYKVVDCEYVWAASGRSALALLYNTIKRYGKINTVLLPDYICNVVYEAANRSGMHIVRYATEDSMPCIDDILHIISSNQECCVTFVSYFGRSIDYCKIIATIREISNEIIIIFDECQNLLNADINVLDENIFSVLSFNNKMTPGLLGGAIVLKNSHYVFSIPLETRFRRIICELEMVLSYNLLFFKMIKTALSRAYPFPSTFEWSSCFGKYSVEPRRIYKVSLVSAYLSVKNVKYHKSILTHNMEFAYQMAEKGIIRIIGSPNAKLVAYLPIEVDNVLVGKIPLKGKYRVLKDESSNKGHVCMILSHTFIYDYKK